MRAAKLLRKVIKLNLSVNKFYVLGDAALVLYGVKEKSDGINLCISVSLYNTLKTQGRIDLSTKDKKGFYKLDDKSNVRVTTKYKKDFNCVKVGDLYLEDIRKIYEFKKEKNKKKNKADVEAIERFLQEHPNYPKF